MYNAIPSRGPERGVSRKLMRFSWLERQSNSTAF
jgi:hypothetical protein